MNNLENKSLKVKKFTQNLRKKILHMAYIAGSNSSHFGGALSMGFIVCIL